MKKKSNTKKDRQKNLLLEHEFIPDGFKEQSDKDFKISMVQMLKR